jgi:hypothetical protein
VPNEASRSFPQWRGSNRGSAAYDMMIWKPVLRPTTGRLTCNNLVKVLVKSILFKEFANCTSCITCQVATC